jgi:hypothetical protein
MNQTSLANDQLQQAADSAREFARLLPGVEISECQIEIAKAWLKRGEPDQCLKVAAELKSSKARNRLVSQAAIAMLDRGEFEGAAAAINTITMEEIITDEHWTWDPILGKFAKELAATRRKPTFDLTRISTPWIQSDIRFRLAHRYMKSEQFPIAISILDDECESKGSEMRTKAKAWTVGRSVLQTRHGVSFRAFLLRVREAASNQPDQTIAAIRAARSADIRDALLTAALPPLALRKDLAFVEKHAGEIREPILRIAAFAAASRFFGQAGKQDLQKGAIKLAKRTPLDADISNDAVLSALALCGSSDELTDRLSLDRVGPLSPESVKAVVLGLGIGGSSTEAVALARELYNAMLYRVRDPQGPTAITPVAFIAAERDRLLMNLLSEGGRAEHRTRFLPLVYWDLLHPSMGGDSQNLEMIHQNGTASVPLQRLRELRGIKSFADKIKPITSSDQMQRFWVDFFKWGNLHIPHPSSLPPECGLRQRDELLKQLALSLAAEADPGWADALLQITSWDLRSDTLHEAVGILWTYVDCGLSREARRAVLSIESEIPDFRKRLGDGFMRAELDRFWNPNCFQNAASSKETVEVRTGTQLV